MSVAAVVLFSLIYIAICVMLMNKYRRDELKERAPWAGKSGIEREFVVFLEIIATPFALLFKILVKARSSSNAERENK